MLLQGIFGNETTEKVLLYLQNYGAGYPRGISKIFDLPISQIQRQLERLEREGVLVSRLIGRTREYTWNPRFYFRSEIAQLLEKALGSMPLEVTEKYFRVRSRPRKRGKLLP